MHSLYKAIKKPCIIHPHKTTLLKLYKLSWCLKKSFTHKPNPLSCKRPFFLLEFKFKKKNAGEGELWHVFHWDQGLARKRLRFPNVFVGSGEGRQKYWCIFVSKDITVLCGKATETRQIDISHFGNWRKIYEKGSIKFIARDLNHIFDHFWPKYTKNTSYLKKTMTYFLK